MAIMNDLEWPMLLYYMTYYEKFRNVMQKTEKEALTWKGQYYVTWHCSKYNISIVLQFDMTIDVYSYICLVPPTYKMLISLLFNSSLLKRLIGCVTNSCKCDHITPIPLLPVQQRINFKCVLYTFKCLHSQAPKYLHDLLRVSTSISSTRWQSGMILLEDKPNR